MTDPQPEPQPQPPAPDTAPDTTPDTAPDVTPETPTPDEGAPPEGEPSEAQPPQGEPPPEAPQPAGKSEEEWEQIGKKLDKSATTWRNRVSELLGESAQDLVPCELCDPTLPGFHFPAASTPPRDDVHARLLQVLLTPEGPDYVFDANQPACGKCDGWGQVATGSKVPNHKNHVCPRCHGTGVEPSAQQLQNGPPEQAPVLAAVGAPDEQPPPADADPWGSPRLLETGQENPNYGKMPQYKSPEFP
jgi:hypothetical protein